MKTTQLVLGALMSLVSPAVVVAAPLLRYTFEEASGNALDSGDAPQTDAVFQGGAVRSSDTPSGTGSSLDLRNDAPNAQLVGQDAIDLDGLSALTLTTWLKLDSYSSGNNRLLSKQFSGMNFNGFSLNMNATTNDGPVGADNFRLGLFLGSGVGLGSVFSSVDVDATQWTFIAVTYDSATGQTSFYTGGVNTPVTQLGATQTFAVNPGVIDGLAARFGVGFTDAAPGADTSAIGRQDDIRVYGTVLTLAELNVARVENVPEPGMPALVATALAGAGLLRRRR
jgi:hypothetical protein